MYSASSFSGELISMPEVYNLCFELALKIKAANDFPEVIVAIGRGGFVPARFICDFLNISALTSIKVHHYSHFHRHKTVTIPFPLSGVVKDQKVLVVDDINDTGLSLAAAVRHIMSYGPSEIKTAVLHEKDNDNFKVDYCAKYIKKWRWIFYPWARMEDLGALLKEMKTMPTTPEKAQEEIKMAYGLQVPIAQIKMVFQLQDKSMYKV